MHYLPTSLRLYVALLLPLVMPMPALAQNGAAASCRAAIASAELGHRIPDAFLSAIARVESGRPVNGMVVPWPWTIDAEGKGSFFNTKADAIAAVQALQARGVRSIDVGCMQVNLQQHPEAFRSLDEAFDPATNADFAASLLIALFNQVRSWPLAAAAYHSQTPTIGSAYQRQVLAAWAQPDQPGPTDAKSAPFHDTSAARKAGASPVAQTASVPTESSFGHQTGFLAGEQPKPALHTTGRGLDAYRQTPVRMAFRLPIRPG